MAASIRSPWACRTTSRVGRFCFKNIGTKRARGRPSEQGGRRGSNPGSDSSKDGGDLAYGMRLIDGDLYTLYMRVQYFPTQVLEHTL